MKASGVYSKSMKIDEFADGEIKTFTIHEAKLFQYQGQADKIEIVLGETDKTIILNVTNNDFLVAKLGDETDEWPGSKIRVTKKKMDRPFKGQTHTLTIVAAKKPTGIRDVPAAKPPVDNEEFDDQF